jgi:MFS transporter, PPP family, 3-phenylpropionic acid transporter
MPSTLFTKLSASYFWYFGMLGLIMPYASVYLDYQTFSSVEIGEILAIATASKIFGPAIWAKMADRTGQQLMIIRLGGLLSVICFSVLWFAVNYWLVALFLALFSLFSAAILPQMEVLTQNSIRRKAKIYARIRLWGSIGFICIAMLAGKLLDYFSPTVFVKLGCLLLIAFFITSLLLQQVSSRQCHLVHEQGSLLTRLIERNIAVFFVIGILLQISFGPYYSFYALYLRDLNYPSYAVGLLIALSVFAEIIVFIFAGRIFSRISVKFALFLSLLLTASRWLLLATWPQVSAMMVLSQLLHAASFALYHCASILFLQRSFADHQQSRAQALYIGGVYGLGGAIGAYLAGTLWQQGAGAYVSFTLAAAMVFVGSIICLSLTITNTDGAN